MTDFVLSAGCVVQVRSGQVLQRTRPDMNKVNTKKGCSEDLQDASAYSKAFRNHLECEKESTYGFKVRTVYEALEFEEVAVWRGYATTEPAFRNGHFGV